MFQRGPREPISESSGDNQEPLAAERSLLLTKKVNGEIGDQDSAENGSGDASIRSLFKFEGSADLALTGFILPFNESSGDGIDERSLNSFEGSGIDERSLYSSEGSGSGVAERALVYISEETDVFSGDNEEEIVDPRSLVTPNPIGEEVFTIYDYYSGDEAADDEAEERFLLSDAWQTVLEADVQMTDMLNRAVEGKKLIKSVK